MREVVCPKGHLFELVTRLEPLVYSSLVSQMQAKESVKQRIIDSPKKKS